MSSTPDSQTPADSPGFSGTESEAVRDSDDGGFSADEFLAELAALDSVPLSPDVEDQATITSELQTPTDNGTVDTVTDTPAFDPATFTHTTETAAFDPATETATFTHTTETAAFDPATDVNHRGSVDDFEVFGSATVTNDLQTVMGDDPNLGTVTGRLDNPGPDPDLDDLFTELGIDEQPDAFTAAEEQAGGNVSSRFEGMVSWTEIEMAEDDTITDADIGQFGAFQYGANRQSDLEPESDDDTTLLGFEKRAGDTRSDHSDSSVEDSEPLASTKRESTLFVAQESKPVENHRGPLSGGRNRASIDRPRTDSGGSHWLSTLAMIALGVIVAVLIAVVVWYFFLQDDKEDGAQVASANTSETSSGDRSSGQTDPARDGTSGLIASAAERPVTISSLRFNPGKTSLTVEATEQTKEIIAFLEAYPSATATIEVRNSSELTTSDSTALAKRQASALRSRFSQADLGDRVEVRALGSLPPSTAHPAPNFVAVTTGIGQPELSDLLGNKDAFSLGLDETGTNLRPEAVRRLGELGVLLAESPSARITLAGYSYSELTPEDNARMAAGTVEAVANRLIHTYDLDPSQISAVVAGSAPYEIPAAIGGMVTVHLSPTRDARFALAQVDVSTVDFAPDTAALQPESAAALDELAELTATGDLRLRLDVASYGQESEAGNAQRSAAIADEVTEALLARGLDESQFLVTASGADSHRSPDDLTGPVVVTAAFS